MLIFEECSPFSKTIYVFFSFSYYNTQCVNDSEVTKAVEGTQELFVSDEADAVKGTHQMLVSDEADRNKAEREGEPASECHNTANYDVQLDCPSQLDGD